MATVVEHMDQISEFINSSKGLTIKTTTENKLVIYQKTDGKCLTVCPVQIEEVIARIDSSNQSFLQVNFISGKKILITEKLVGFKPAKTTDLDMSKVPKVVTTPDLISVVEAIEESIHCEETHPDEVNILKRVFDSVLRGGEDIGFDLNNERTWLNMLANTKIKPSA